MGHQRKKRPNELLKATQDTCVSTKSDQFSCTLVPCLSHNTRLPSPKITSAASCELSRCRKAEFELFQVSRVTSFTPRLRWPHSLSGTKTPCRTFGCEQWVALLFVNECPIQRNTCMRAGTSKPDLHTKSQSGDTHLSPQGVRQGHTTHC